MDAIGDLPSVSIESISALKQAEIRNQFAVKVMKGINDQAEAVAAQIVNLIEGKGQILDITV